MVRAYLLVGLLTASAISEYMTTAIAMLALGASLLILAFRGRLPMETWARMWRMPIDWVARFTKAIALCILATGVLFLVLATVEAFRS